MATQAKAKYILDALVTRLRTIDGTGVYNYDLSGTTKVVRRQRLPATAPSVSVYLPQSEGDQFASLSRREPVLQVYLDLRVTPTAGDYAATEDALLNMQSDICRIIGDLRALSAITEAAANPTQIVDIVATRLYRHGDDIGAPELPNGRIVVELKYITTLTEGI